MYNLNLPNDGRLRERFDKPVKISKVPGRERRDCRHLTMAIQHKIVQKTTACRITIHATCPTIAIRCRTVQTDSDGIGLKCLELFANGLRHQESIRNELKFHAQRLDRGRNCVPVRAQQTFSTKKRHDFTTKF